MAVAHVQSDWDVKSTSGATHTYASGRTVTSGNLIVVGIKYAGPSVTATVTDNFGNTYEQTPTGYITNGGSDAVGMNRGAVFYAKNITGGANYTVTVTYSASVGGDQDVLVFHEVSGADATSPLVASAGQAQAAPGTTGTDPITSTAATPTAANSYVFGFFSGGQDNTTVTAGTGFSAGENIGALPNNYNISSEYLIQGAAASVAATFDESASLTHTIAMMAAFQPTAAGGPTVPQIAAARAHVQMPVPRRRAMVPSGQRQGLRRPEVIV